MSLGDLMDSYSLKHYIYFFSLPVTLHVYNCMSDYYGSHVVCFYDLELTRCGLVEKRSRSYEIRSSSYEMRTRSYEKRSRSYEMHIV